MAKQIDGTIFLNKNEALNEVDILRKNKTPLRGIEIVDLTDGQIITHYEKAVWFKTQRLCYTQAKQFIQKQMIGQWQWVEFKL